MASLAPTLLVSMPQLLDPNFKRSVVLLCMHGEEGAFGLVVNRPVVATGRVVIRLDPPVEAERDLHVWIGGPVEPERSWMLVNGVEELRESFGGISIADRVFLSTSPELLRRVINDDSPATTRLVVGYAGWGPGQLEAEIEESAWLLGEVSEDLLFKTPADQMWEQAIRRMGADPEALHGSRGVH